MNPRLALAALLVVASLMAQAHAGPLQVGDPAPTHLDWWTKLSDYRGKVVIVTFWASWCAPCRKELAVLGKIQQAATRDKLVVVAVNWQESRERFRQLKRALKDLELTLVSDADGGLGRQYGVKGIPHMVIIAPDGRIAAIHAGYGDDAFRIIADQLRALAHLELVQSPP